MPWRGVAGEFCFGKFSVGVVNLDLRLKGPSYEAGTRLQAASGLHHLIGNHWHVLVCRGV
jgi:hypothetical protein